MSMKRIIAIGAILACTSMVWGCGNGGEGNNRQSANQQENNVQSEGWGDPKRLEASHLEALERMEKDHIHRMVSLSADIDGDQVMTTLERSSQKLEEMRPLAEMLQHEGHPALLQRIQAMSGDIQGSKGAITQMKTNMRTGKIKIQSTAKTDALHHISSFHDYHEYVQKQIQIMSKGNATPHSLRN